MGTEHVSRFYSLALGKEKNFYARTDGLIVAGDTTPDVSLHSLLYADTGGNLNITYFDNGVEGQIIHLINLGAGEVQFSGAQMLVTDSSDLYANDNITFLFHNSSWYELGREHSAAIDIRTVAAGDATPTVQNTKTLIFNSAGALAVTDFDDGYEGQILRILNIGAGDVTLQRGAELIVADSSNLGTNDSVILTQRNAAWYELSKSHNIGETVTAAAGDATPSVKNRKVVIFNSAGAITVTDFDDEYEGQELTVLNLGAGNVTITDADPIFIANTAGNFVLVTAGAAKFVCSAHKWYNIQRASTP